MMREIFIGMDIYELMGNRKNDQKKSLSQYLCVHGVQSIQIQGFQLPSHRQQFITRMTQGNLSCLP